MSEGYFGVSAVECPGICLLFALGIGRKYSRGMSKYTDSPRSDSVKSKMRESGLEFDRIRILSAIDLISARISDGGLAKALDTQLDEICELLAERKPLQRQQRELVNMLIRVIHYEAK